MWQKRLKQFKKQMINQAISQNITAQTSTPKQPQIISFKEYCQELHVTPLKNDVVTLNQPPTSPKVYATHSYTSQTNYYNPLEMFDEDAAKSEFSRFGQRKLPKELREGKFSIAATLDLHNYNKAHAIELLSLFIEEHKHAGCLKVIHGQGLNSECNKPILLGAIRRFLEYHPLVVAYSFGAPRQGGGGVTLIKLKGPK